MRFSELLGREIIDYQEGKQLGVLSNADLLFDETTGEIDTLIIPLSSWKWFKQKQQEIQFKWSNIHTIGVETIIVDPKNASYHSK